MTLIILEGPDCAGKSSLAGRLVDALRAAHPGDHVAYRHAGVPQDPPLEEYVEPLLGYRPGTGQHVVCDRWHLGESVYPALTGRRTDLTEQVRVYVELFLRSRGAVLVYCAASYDYLRDCGVARGDDQVELARIYDVGVAFNRALVASTVPRMTVDASDEHADAADHARTVGQVLGVAERLDRAARPLTPFVTYVGPPRPTLLLVGDRRGTPCHDLAEFGDWPAFAPGPGTSGTYLLTSLLLDELNVRDHGVRLADVGLANACDVDDVAALWHALGHPAVVGLGRNAQRALARVAVPHRAVEHPQYRRRFYHHDQETYARLLLGLPQEVPA